MKQQVSKTCKPQGFEGSNPSLSVFLNPFQKEMGYFLFFTPAHKAKNRAVLLQGEPFIHPFCYDINMAETLSAPALSREEKQFIIMTQTPVGKLVARLSVPTVISMLVSAIYNITDTFYVAHLGESAAGAVGVVFSLMSLIQALGMGVGMGASSLVSRCLGKRDPQTASKYVSSAFFFGAFIGLCILVLGEVNVNRLMRWLGSTDTILPYACAYGHYILIAAPIMCAAFVLNTTLRAEGKAFFSMIGLSTGALINIAIAPVFIYVLDMGIAGAAIAVLICQSLSLCILLSFFLRKKSVTTLSYKLISRDWRDYWHLVRLGSPTTLRQGFASLAMALLNIKASLFGDAAVAAVSIATKIYLAMRGIVLGIGQAMQPVAGYNHGAKLYDRVRKSFWVTARAGTVICTVAAVVLAIWARPVIAVFRTGNEDVVLIGVQTLYFFCAALPFLAYSTYVNQLLQILGQAKSAAFLASCRQGIMFLPLVFILPHYFGLSGVEATQPAADMLTFFVSIPFLTRFFAKYQTARRPLGAKRHLRLIYLKLARKLNHWTEPYQK